MTRFAPPAHQNIVMLRSENDEDRKFLESRGFYQVSNRINVPQDVLLGDLFVRRGYFLHHNPEVRQMLDIPVFGRGTVVSIFEWEIVSKGELKQRAHLSQLIVLPKRRDFA